MRSKSRTITVLAGLSLLLVACAPVPAAPVATAPAGPAATPTTAPTATTAPPAQPPPPTATQAATEPAKAPAQAAVTIDNFAFAPQSLQVKVGTTVTWTNKQSATHTATSDTGEWDSGRLSQGQSFSFTFTKAGTFAYHCAIHSSMTGTIEVTD